MGLVVSALTGVKLLLECHNVNKQDTSFIVLEYLYVFVLMAVSVFALLVFMYSANYFPNLYYGQLPHIKKTKPS